MERFWFLVSTYRNIQVNAETRVWRDPGRWWVSGVGAGRLVDRTEIRPAPPSWGADRGVAGVRLLS